MQSEGQADTQRTVGVWGATGVGVGAIVGGGILALAGAALAATGPAAIVAFALNGVVAFITAMSFAEISSSFPQSGGAYTFAKRVLSVRAAFVVGWIIWFAYIVAGVLYALGFAAFASESISALISAFGGSPASWIASRGFALLLASTATATYAAALIRKESGGGQWETIGKVLVFTVLIAFGLMVFVRTPLERSMQPLTPFFSGGTSGLIKAMGFTFIALQGFDLIAAIAGEIKDPARTIPKSMFRSLSLALAIYLPLLLLVCSVGVPEGQTVEQMARNNPDTAIAVAAENYMGRTGYWLVLIAGLLSMLSALQANMLAASRVALSMALDRTLPAVLGRRHGRAKTPAMAIYASALTLVAIAFMIPNLAAAGAAASLIFLLSFALTHLTAYLSRKRLGRATSYRTPAFPLIPAVGGLSCAALSVYQALAVPSAGAIIVVWLGLGVVLYVALFAQDAETADASAEASDPDLVRLRGRSPLVLLPVANPQHAEGLIAVANALSPPQIGRVLLLTIVAADRADLDSAAERLPDAQRVVSGALRTSYQSGHSPEALITTASDPWDEIRRVATEHKCESLLLGVGEISGFEQFSRLQRLMANVDCDVALMRSPSDWQLTDVKRILVPIGGGGQQHGLRARLLSSLCRAQASHVTFVRVLAPDTSTAGQREAEQALRRLAQVKLPGKHEVQIVVSDDPLKTIVDLSEKFDLIAIGLRPRGSRLGSARPNQQIVSEFAMRVAKDAHCATIMLSRH
ncbi:MAG: amino acid permease [Deltaproteobacteria bacterium]|nr:amino acid permease [Deltaproteobacteria bacterium]